MVDIPLLIRDLVFFLLVALVVNFITAKLSVPYTLGLVIVGLCIGFIGLAQEAKLSPDLVLFVFLPALLFEAGWSANLTLLRENWRAIFFLAGPGLLLSLLIIATAFHFLDQLDWATAFLLAAILSPTDPVAVLGLFRQLHVNERLSIVIEGESLFNDGVAVVAFRVLVAGTVGGAGAVVFHPVQAAAMFVWWPAGVAMVLLSAVLAVSLRGPTQRIGPARMGEEEAWSDLAAVMEESIHGQDDVRQPPLVGLALPLRGQSIVFSRECAWKRETRFRFAGRQISGPVRIPSARSRSPRFRRNPLRFLPLPVLSPCLPAHSTTGQRPLL